MLQQIPLTFGPAELNDHKEFLMVWKRIGTHIEGLTAIIRSRRDEGRRAYGRATVFVGFSSPKKKTLTGPRRPDDSPASDGRACQFVMLRCLLLLFVGPAQSSFIRARRWLLFVRGPSSAFVWPGVGFSHRSAPVAVFRSVRRRLSFGPASSFLAPGCFTLATTTTTSPPLNL